MGEEDSNPDIIRKVNKELSDIRKEQRILRLWGGVLLCAGLLLQVGFLWVLKLGIKQPAPEETAFEYPMPVMSAEEDSSIWITDKISDDTSNTSNTDNMNADAADNTDSMGETDETNEYPSTSVLATVPTTTPAVVSPVGTRSAVIHRSVARAVKTAVRPARKKTVTSIPPHIITRPEMTLRSLARLYYGSEVFWVYIYDRNIRVLSSLDTLPSGIELELPRPSDYGIDATEPTSLQRACQLAKSLVKQ